MAAAFKKLFKQVADPEPDVQERIHYKIRAFNSIVSILAQIQRDPPFQDAETPRKTPPSSSERRQLKLSNAFAHLAVIDTDVVAATLYTPQVLSVMTWNKEQSSDDEDEPAQDTENPKSLWGRFFWLFTTNTKNNDMRSRIAYQGPSIAEAMPPEGYPKGSDPRVNLLQYLDEFPKKW